VATFGQGIIANDANVANDHLGTAIVAKDVDGDGFTDLIAGVPGKDNGSLMSTGLVVRYFGSSAGLAGGTKLPLWPIGVSGSTLQFSQSGDKLGTTLVVADFDADGMPDLVAGMPGRNGDAGAFEEYLNTGGGFFAVRYMDEATAVPQ
jgi:hypothetical protein